MLSSSHSVSIFKNIQYLAGNPRIFQKDGLAVLAGSQKIDRRGPVNGGPSVSEEPGLK